MSRDGMWERPGACAGRKAVKRSLAAGSLSGVRNGVRCHGQPQLAWGEMSAARWRRARVRERYAIWIHSSIARNELAADQGARSTGGSLRSPGLLFSGRGQATKVDLAPDLPTNAILAL